MSSKICVIGLGYVGLPLAVAFSKEFDVVGFDINQKRIAELQSGIDHTKEISSLDLKKSNHLQFTSDIKSIRHADFYIVTVPTPITENNVPDLTYLESASEMVGSVIAKDNIVIYESTVYPGATEEICIPIIEKISGMKLNLDFYAGYSPERINPGDKKHTIDKITKVVSGSNPNTAIKVRDLYSKIIKAGVFVASSIQVAEAAKVIENTQRDLNIALINELSMIFSKLNINTFEVLEAASTKWNFINFKPGLVGGHCIGVDPYYLTHKSQLIGYDPKIILAGRSLNDEMASLMAKKFIKKFKEKNIGIEKSRVLVLGLTFKENCPDLRNSKVFNLAHDLTNYGLQVDIFDPEINSSELKSNIANQNFNLVTELATHKYDGLIMAVSHQKILDIGYEALLETCKQERVIFDLKNALPRHLIDISI